jgi:hypothetical protein
MKFLVTTRAGSTVIEAASLADAKNMTLRVFPGPGSGEVRVRKHTDSVLGQTFVIEWANENGSIVDGCHITRLTQSHGGRANSTTLNAYVAA